MIALFEMPSRFVRDARLPLITPTFGHQDGHYATKFLPTEVRVLKFRTADVSAKYKEKHRNKRIYLSFDSCESRILIYSMPFSGGCVLGMLLLKYCILLEICFIGEVDGRSAFQFQLFQFFFGVPFFLSMYI